MSWELHSKVYLDTSAPFEAVVEQVSRHIGGTAHRSGAEGRILDVYVDENDEHDVVRAEDREEGFLFYPYLLDVDAVAGVTVDAYRDALDALLQALALPWVRFVTAAEDEEALWRGGRWDGRGPPPAKKP